MYASDLKHPTPSLEDRLHHLYSLNREKTIDLSFRPPYLDLLKAFGNPHLNLPPVIHVAGTNGKGSTISMLRAILEEAGYKVHAYTSPHLIKFNERIVLAGEPISDEQLEDLIDEALALNEDRPVTFFEITTAMAFAAFSRVPADILLLEVGLGGRLDCTNVVENPLATVITAIGRDHTEYLGETLPEIAAEKAGIMKPGVPCVIGPQSEASVYTLFEETAQKHACILHTARPVKNYEPPLAGEHQKDNLATALKTLDVIAEHLPVREQHIQQGLQKTRWPGRLEKIEKGTLAEILPAGWELWFDGGHNEDAGKALAAQAKLWQAQDEKPLHLIVGMKENKDSAAFLRPLLPFAQNCIIIPIPGMNECLELSRLKLRLSHGNICNFYEKKCVKDAVNSVIIHNPKTQGRILVTGSLYLSGVFE